MYIEYIFLPQYLKIGDTFEIKNNDIKDEG